jgi:hypothetical protein
MNAKKKLDTDQVATELSESAYFQPTSPQTGKTTKPQVGKTVSPQVDKTTSGEVHHSLAAEDDQSSEVVRIRARSEGL